jgi:O-antigen ligase
MQSLMTAVQRAALVLCIASATLVFGGVTPDLAASAFGFGLVAVLIWLGRLIFAQPCLWKRSPMHLLVAAFMAYTLIRYFTAPVEYEARFELFQVFLYGLIYFTVASNLGRAADRNVFLIAMALLAVGQSTYAFWQFARGDDLVLHLSRPYEYHGRGGGTFICPNHLAAFLEMVLGLLLARTALVGERVASLQTAVLQKVLLAFATLVTLVGILVTFSRGGWIVTFLGLMIFLIWGRWALQNPWLRIGLAVAAVAAFLVIGVKMLPDRLSFGRTFTTDAQTQSRVVKDTTLGDRMPLWLATLRIIRDYPLVGTGPGTWRWFHGQYREPQIQENPEYAHSDVLNLTSDYGLVGLALVLAFFACFYRHAFALARRGASAEERSFAVGSALAVTMIIFHSFIDFSLHLTANALLLVTILGLTSAMTPEGCRSGATSLPETKPWLRWSLAGTLAACCVLGLWFFPRTALAYYYWSRGSDAKAVLHWDKALARYARAIELDPKFPAPCADAAGIMLGKARMKRPAEQAKRRELVDTAADLLYWSTELNPRQTLVLLRLAEAYELRGETEKAITTFERAKAIDPKAAVVYVRWGMLYRNLGEDEKAEKVFKEGEKFQGDEVSQQFLFNRQ